MSPALARERLAVFARAPRLGRVKTRLSPPLTQEQALTVHRALVEDTLERLGAFVRSGLERWLYLSEPLSGPEELEVPPGWKPTLQQGSNLGARLAAAFREALDAGPIARLVIIGSDSPTLPLECVEDAFATLAEVEVVLGPAKDGGYYLVGCSRFVPELFKGVPWGTDLVLKESVEALRRAGCAFKLLQPWYDVDTQEDLKRLKEEIEFFMREAPHQVPRRIAAVLSADLQLDPLH